MNKFSTAPLILVVVLLLLIHSCSSSKTVYQTGGIKEAITNSINDFSSTQLYKRGEVFEVSYTEDYYLFSLKEDENGTYAWLPDKNYPEIYGISILNNNTKFSYIASDIGKVSNNVPSVVLKKGDKLFYWWDDNIPLTKRVVDILLEFNLINVTQEYLDYRINDSQKSMQYYVCKSNIAKYKRVLTNKAIGYYSPPNLNCD